MKHPSLLLPRSLKRKLARRELPTNTQPRWLDVNAFLADTFPRDTDECVILTKDLDIVEVIPSFDSGHQNVEYFWMPSHGDCYDPDDIKGIMPKSWLVDLAT